MAGNYLLMVDAKKLNEIREQVENIEKAWDEALSPEEKQRLKAFAELQLRTDIQEFVRKANEEYWSKDELRRRPLPVNAEPELLWELCRLYRTGWSKKVSFKRSGLALSYAINDKILKRLHELSELNGSECFDLCNDVVEFAITHANERCECLRMICE